MTGLALLALLGTGPDTLEIRAVDVLPEPGDARAVLGRPAMSFGEGRVLVWLVRAADTVAIYAAMRDPSPSADDEIVVSLDMAGDAAGSPQHDDFQWRLRRVLDSSVVYRGRGGRWEPPRDDPAWRLGSEREGGGWQVDAAEASEGWRLVLRLHAAMLAGEGARRPALAFRVYDGTPGGWYAWPTQRAGAHPTEVERAPFLWAPVASEP